jgi:hypothetical protein
MAIADKGYGESGRVGFDDASERDDDGKVTARMTPDEMTVGSHFLEVVGLDCFESKAGDDYFTAWLFDPASGKITRDFGKVTSKTMWKLDRSVGAIFGKQLPVEKIQGPGGRMPMDTRKRALGVYVEVAIKDSDYEGQDVLILSGPYSAPEGVKPMYHLTGDNAHEPTGAWPTGAAALIKSRGTAGGNDW